MANGAYTHSLSERDVAVAFNQGGFSAQNTLAAVAGTMAILRKQGTVFSGDRGEYIQALTRVSPARRTLAPSADFYVNLAAAAIAAGADVIALLDAVLLPALAPLRFFDNQVQAQRQTMENMVLDGLSCSIYCNMWNELTGIELAESAAQLARMCGNRYALQIVPGSDVTNPLVNTTALQEFMDHRIPGEFQDIPAVLWGDRQAHGVLVAAPAPIVGAPVFTAPGALGETIALDLQISIKARTMSPSSYNGPLWQGPA